MVLADAWRFLRSAIPLLLIASGCTSPLASAPASTTPASQSAATNCTRSNDSSIISAITTPTSKAEVSGARSVAVPNGDFANGLEGWLISDPATARLEPDGQGTGDKLRILVPATKKLRFVNSAPFAVTPGAGYDVVVGAQLAAGSSNFASFSLVFLSPSEVGRKVSRFEPFGRASTYSDYTIAGIVPPGAKQAMMQISYDRQEGTGDLSIYDVSYAEIGMLEISGWAIDRDATGSGGSPTGIDSVSLYLDGPPATGTFVGIASLGDRRDDVARGCGDQRLLTSGWHYRWNVGAIRTGTHTLNAVIRATSGATSQVATTFVMAAAFPDDPIGGIDVPVARTTISETTRISGWAIDRNSTSGPGIDSVTAYLDGGHDSSTLVGTATYGEGRPGVALHFGDAFKLSGWHLDWNAASVSRGDHTLSFLLHSSVTGATTTLTREVNVGGGRDIAGSKPAGASNALPGSPPEMAVDGLPATFWNSGHFAPQWIELDLEATVAVERLRLVVSQAPSGPTTHRVYGRGPTGGEVLLHEFSGITTEGQMLEYSPPAPWTGIRFIRVETVTSPSWVAWREIGVYLANATSTGTVSGAVRSGERAVPGAQVEIRAGDTVTQAVFTDDAGAYSFEGIPPGTYTVRAYAPTASLDRRRDSEPQTLDPGARVRVPPLVLDPR